MPNNNLNSKNNMYTTIILAMVAFNTIPLLTHEHTVQYAPNARGQAQLPDKSVKAISDSLFFATAQAFTPEVPSGGSGNQYVTNEIITGGTQTVIAGGTTSNIYANSNGVQDIKNGGLALSTQVHYYGIQYVHLNGVAIDTEVYAHGEQFVDGGLSESAQIYDGGRQLVIDGIAKNAQVHSGGIQSVFFAGSTQDAHIYDGGLQRIYDGGSALSTQVHSGGTQIVDYHGSATDTTIQNGAVQYVNSGGTAATTTINNGGLSIFAAGAVISGIVNNNGILDLSRYDGTQLEISGNAGKILLYQIGRPTQKQLTINSLSGLQTIAISADLANNKADRIDIGTASGTHYIKVLRELTDGSDLPYITGQSVTVANTTTGGADFQGAVSAIDGVNVQAVIQQDNNNWNLVGYKIIGPSNLSKTDIIGADMAYIALRSSVDNLQQRLSELRQEDTTGGAWIRIYNGQSGISGNTMQYTTIQGGYDFVNKQRSGKSATGISIEHLRADNSYITGSGKLNNTLFGAYHTWFGNSGHYYNIIAKAGRLYNEITVYDEEIIKGSYTVNNLSISATYGYRHTLPKGYFITPHLGIQYGSIDAINYTTDSGTLVRQDAITSWLGQIGLTIGRTIDNHELYVSVKWLRELQAKSKVATGRTRNAYTIEDDFRGSSIELGLGGSIRLNRNSRIHILAERSFGGKISNKWRLQAGYRLGFN